jgi:hypothetical protein
MPRFLQLSAIPLALKNEKLLKAQLIQFSLISAARHLCFTIVWISHEPGFRQNRALEACPRPRIRTIVFLIREMP